MGEKNIQGSIGLLRDRILEGGSVAAYLAVEALRGKSLTIFYGIFMLLAASTALIAVKGLDEK